MAIKHAIRYHVCELSCFPPGRIIADICEQVIHLLFCWSSFLSWTLLIIDLLLIGFLAMHAYQDGKSDSTQYLPLAFIGYPILITPLVDTLDHFEVPIFGRLANSFVDDE